MFVISLRCDYAASQKGQLQYHINAKHLGLKPFECAEEGCDFATTAKASLKKHVRQRHLKLKEPKPHLCPHCGYGAATAKLLEGHVARRHDRRKEIKPGRNARVLLVGTDSALDMIRARANK